ncbi:MAG: alanine--glyoxylate aminotransferase [Panacagrimonas sp.]|jgi:alanine-glyoxylate transaminase/serine-glyoxylate transaminase/serine-pyruvate transaminase|nr:alanine--glyoxylate aminotransferase family protein [Panacagrimonas sp.]MCC2657714.1 alanine--glyoxylate aminotransferase [Panacagrimonas sp.]
MDASAQSSSITPAFVAPRRVLMGPGPSDVHPRVLAAMAQPTIGHLDPAFIGLMDEIKRLLQRTLRTDNELTMPVSGPGSAGMEACFANLLEPGDTIVVCENGVFGGRMRAMSERIGAKVVTVSDPWGRAVDPAKVEDALAANPDAKVLAFVQAETSTGALSDARTIASIAQRRGVLTLVDAVTSLGGSPLEMDAWGIDAVYSGTQKCLSCPPGLSPVSFGPRALAKLNQRKTKVGSWFMDFTLVTAYWGSGAKRSYHHTAPVNALYGLHEALRLLHEEGLEHSWSRHQRLHGELAAGLEALGLEYIVPKAERLPQLNAVKLPVGVTEEPLRRRLLDEHALEVGGGLGDFAGKIWRIGLMGQSCTPYHVQHCLSAVGAVLGKSG